MYVLKVSKLLAKRLLSEGKENEDQFRVKASIF